MKHKISISIDEETLIALREQLRQKNFRNRSHAIESAIQKMLE
jgi:Arc/MetJ-type ribon-helix-helix transcriptional regulator